MSQPNTTRALFGERDQETGNRRLQELTSVLDKTGREPPADNTCRTIHGRVYLPERVRKIMAEEAAKHLTTISRVMGRCRSTNVTRARCAIALRLLAGGMSAAATANMMGLNHSSVLYYKHGKLKVAKRAKEQTEIHYPDLSGEWAI